MTRLILEGIMVIILSNVVTGVTLWKLGQKNGAKWEKYRQETLENSQKNIPYGDRFRKDMLLDIDNPPPLIVHHRRRKFNGQWTDD